MKVEALVVGAGIGGLVAALELRKAGIDVRIFESAREVRPLGVGINLLPHCVRHLDELGAMERLLEIGVSASEQVFFNKFGQRIWTDARGLAAGYKWPQISIHRGELQVALMNLVRERISADRIHLGWHLEAFENRPDGVAAHFIDRANGDAKRQAKGDILIGADGIHSTVRKQFYPDEGPAKWNGALIYRAVSETRPFLSGRSHFMAGGAQTLIGYPISKAHMDRGCSLTNWAARFFIDPARGFAREDWNRRGDIADFLPRYENWRFDWFDMPELIKSAPAVWEFPMVDRDPLPQWTFGRATLMGDAAHAMYPLGSNGASQSIIDANALANALKSEENIESALHAYENDRRPKTARIVLHNRQGGPERIVRMCEERAPEGFDDIEKVIPMVELLGIIDEYKKLASFDLETVNR